ncbi:MAG: hypothetical protein ABSD99_08060 [Candidatus Bathyarchaeia archaeon]
MLLPLFMQLPDSNAQTAAHLTVSMTGQTLVAGLNNTMTVTVSNSYSGYIAIYDVDISVSLPAPLVLVGDNHWHYDSIQYGQSVTLTFPVYAPSSAAGTSYQGTVTGTYKQLGDVSYTQESHTLGVSVTGYISLVVYGIEFTPSTITSGGNTTISGNVLNSGNLASYNANVTVESDSIVSGPQNSAFLGEIDPNIPRPFSVLIVFKPNLAPGNYTVTVKISATDNNRPGIPIVGGASGQIQVIKPSQTAGGRSTGFSLISLIITFLRNLFNTFFGSSFP